MSVSAIVVSRNVQRRKEKKQSRHPNSRFFFFFNLCTWPQAETCCSNFTPNPGWYYNTLSLCNGRVNFQHSQTLFTMTNSALFSLAWLHWPHMMNVLLERERNRACCYLCSQLISQHTAEDSHTHRSAYCGASTNSCGVRHWVGYPSDLLSKHWNKT